MFLQFQLFKFTFQHFLFPNISSVLIGLLQNHLSYMTRPLSSNGSLPFRTRGDIPSLTPVLSKSVATEAWGIFFSIFDFQLFFFLSFPLLLWIWQHNLFFSYFLRKYQANLKTRFVFIPVAISAFYSLLFVRNFFLLSFYTFFGRIIHIAPQWSSLFLLLSFGIYWINTQRC